MLQETFTDETESFQGLQCCECAEGIKLQTALLNHLFTHLPPLVQDPDISVKEEFYESIDGGSEIIDQEDFKRKPSYHRRFNRRDRSPETEKVQSEFTYDEETKLFHCNICRNGYKHKQNVERHLSKEHDTRKTSKTFSYQCDDEAGFSFDANSEKFVCDMCPSAYKHKQSVERHLAKQHNVTVEKKISRSVKKSIQVKLKPETMICDLCGHQFMFRESLRKHLLKHVEPVNDDRHNPAPKPVKEKIVCDQCTKLVHPALMKRHFRVHHSDYRPFKCEEPGCKTSFFDVAKFNDHMNIHLKIKPYVCEFCNESFHYASNWRQHKLRHTEPDRFKCEICSNCFVSTKSLRLHMRLHTEVDPNAPKPFPCGFDGCDKAFQYQDRLKLHMFNVHRTEPDHKCDM